MACKSKNSKQRLIQQILKETQYNLFPIYEQSLFNHPIDPHQARVKAHIRSTERLNEEIADHDNKIYLLATEASKLKDSLSTKTLSSDMARIEGEQRVQEKYEYHMKNLENDKASLSKRLSIVLMELDKITTEKTDYEQQMTEQLKLNSELEEKIMKSEGLSKTINKNLQDDLRYEKELNDKLRDDLNRYESQKSQLLIQLREQQGIEEQFQGEIGVLEDGIKNKENEITGLIDLHKKTRKEIGDLEAEAAALRKRLAIQDTNIDELEIEVKTIENEKNNLINRMNDLTNKYDAYISTMSREREDLLNTARRHIKLLTAKILSERLNALVKKQYYASISHMTTKLNKDQSKYYMAERIYSILSRLRRRKLKTTFQKWHQSLLNWPNERQRRERLLESMVRDKAKRKGFRLWLQWCRIQKENRKEVAMGTKKLWYTLEGIGRGLVKEAFLRMKRLWHDDSRKEIKLSKIITQRHNRNLRLAIETWRVVAKKMRQQIAFEYLANQLAEGHMRQIVFHRFKDAVRQSKIEKLTVKYRMLRYWRNAKRKRDQTKKAAVLALKIEKTKNDKAARRALHILQQNRIECQLFKLSNNLQNAMDEHKDLENTLHANKDRNEANNKTLAIKRLACHLSNRIYPYFAKWQRYCTHYRRGMNKLKLLTYTVYRNKLADVMSQWRVKARKSVLGKTDSIIKEASQRIQELELEQLNKQNLKAEADDAVKARIDQKLSKNIAVVTKMYLRRYLRQWNGNAKNIQKGDSKLQKMCRRWIGIKKWLAVMRFRDQVRKLSTAQMWQNRIDYLHKKRDKNNLRRSLRRLGQFAQRMGKAKLQMLKAIRRYEACNAKSAFQEWMRTIRQHRIYEKQAEAKALKEQERDVKIKHEELTDENKRLRDKKEEHQVRLKEKTLLILWNNLVRQKTLDYKSAYSRWQLATLMTRKKNKRLHKIFCEIIMGNERKALDKWLKLIRQRNAQEKAKDFEDKKTQMEVDRSKGQLEVDMRVAERNDAEKILEKSQQTAAKAHAIAEKVMGKLIRERELNVYKPLREAVLSGWSDVANKQKRLTGKLMGLARRHMLEHIFIKMKNATVEREEAQSRVRALKKLMVLAGRSHLRNAFDTWRNEAYSQQMQNFAVMLENKQQEIQQAKERTEKVNERLYSNAEQILEKRLKGKVLHKMASVCTRKRFLKDKIAAFRKNKDHAKKKAAVQKWRSRVTSTEFLHLKTAKAINNSNRNILRRVLRKFNGAVKAVRTLPKALNKLSNRMFMHNLLKCGLLLKGFVHSRIEHTNAVRKNGEIRFGSMLERLIKARLITYLGLLSSNAKVIQSRSNKLARAVVTMYLRRIREGMHTLNKAKSHKQLEESVENEGQQAQKLRELQEEVELMNDTLANEGYEQEIVEKKVKEINDNKERLIKKALARWMAYQEGEGNIIDVIDQWRKFMEEKSAVKNSLNRLVNFLSNRLLHKGFTRWRNSNKRTKEVFKTCTKDELIEQAMDKSKKQIAAQDQVNTKKARLEEEESVLKQLEVKHRLSKYFAFSFINKQNKKALMKALQRWREKSNRIRFGILRAHLDELSARINDTVVTNDDLETKNSSLIYENEELRRLSLESVDLVVSMKSLNKQKTNLSVDLADRANTIRKLLEDNKILKEKLLLAQKEADSGLRPIARSGYQFSNQ